jgi:septal ring factor EnvC (AmiA/AmiB activator)
MRDDFDAIPDPGGRRDTAGTMLPRIYHDLGLAAVADAVNLRTVESALELKDSLERGELNPLPAESGSPIAESSIGAATVAAKATVARVLCLNYRRLKLSWMALVSGVSKARTSVRQLKGFYHFNKSDDTEHYAFVTQDLEQDLLASLQETVEKADPEHGLAPIERQNDEDRTYRISYDELLAPIVKSIQEQQQEIASARQHNADLRHAVQALQEQVASLRAENEALRHSLELLSERVSEAFQPIDGRSSN